VKRSPTPTPEDNEQYEDRRRNYKAERNTHRSHRGEDLILRTRMQREEYNLNQRTRQLDVHEAHLCICDRREAEIRTARMRGTDVGSESGSE
jgi:hypothetical protein